MKVFAFDFDGVIIDSTKFLAENYKKFLKNYGITPTEEDLNFFFSNTIDNILKYLNEKYKIKISRKKVEDYFFEKEKELILGFKNSEHIKELKDLINFLKEKGFKVIILSHSPFDRIIYAIKTFELEGFFDEIISDERILTDKVDYFHNYIYYNKVKDAFLLDDSPKIVIKAKNYQINPILYFNPLRITEEFAKVIEKNENIPVVKRFKEVKELLNKSFKF